MQYDRGEYRKRSIALTRNMWKEREK
jgi:hypothetical protein